MKPTRPAENSRWPTLDLEAESLKGWIRVIPAGDNTVWVEPTSIVSASIVDSYVAAMRDSAPAASGEAAPMPSANAMARMSAHRLRVCFVPGLLAVIRLPPVAECRGVGSRRWSGSMT